VTYDPKRDSLPEYLVRSSWPGGLRLDPPTIRSEALDDDAYLIALVSEAWRLNFGWWGSMEYIGTGTCERVEAARRGRHKAKLRHEAEGFLRAIDLLIAVPAPVGVSAADEAPR
jgi:hypothetical protein